MQLSDLQNHTHLAATMDCCPLSGWQLRPLQKACIYVYVSVMVQALQERNKFICPSFWCKSIPIQKSSTSKKKTQNEKIRMIRVAVILYPSIWPSILSNLKFSLLHSPPIVTIRPSKNKLHGQKWNFCYQRRNYMDKNELVKIRGSFMDEFVSLYVVLLLKHMPSVLMYCFISLFNYVITYFMVGHELFPLQWLFLLCCFLKNQISSLYYSGKQNFKIASWLHLANDQKVNWKRPERRCLGTSSLTSCNINMLWACFCTHDA